MDALNKQKVSLLGLYIDNVTEDELLKSVKDNLDRHIKSSVVFVNSDVAVKANRDAQLKRIINEAEFAAVDGMPLKWAAGFLGHPVKERVAGSDFVPRFLEMARDNNRSVFILGGDNGAAEAAADNIGKKLPGIKIAGTYEPPFGFENSEEELGKTCEVIRQSGADALIACLGCPKQEKFIYDNRDRYDAVVSICAGATVDFLAGRVKRCPAWLSKLGFEWLYRFTREPKRLFKRYFIDDMRILALIMRFKLAGK